MIDPRQLHQTDCLTRALEAGAPQQNREVCRMFAPHVDLNPLIEGWEILSWSVGPTGEEIHVLLVESAEKVEGMRYMLGDCPGYDAKLLCVSEHYHWDLSLSGLTRAFSYYCGLTSDRHLLFSPERIGQPNATLFDGGGNELCRFWVGDHVEHLQSDTSGNLWISYYDQGFGKEYSERGLSCYDSNGHAVKPWWNCPMMDCYAMNAGRDGVWHCGYSYFSIVHVGSDRGLREWGNRHVSGARAIVGWGQRVALYGGYGERGQHLTTLKLTDSGEAKLERECVASLPDSPEIPWATGRGPYFHALDQGVWYRLDPRII